ncbi:MAG: hypothetical protein WCJ60_01790 [bacterium]
MRSIPNESEKSALEYNQSLAPVNGAFHDQSDLQLFKDNPREQYLPASVVVDRLCSLDAVATISGPFGVGKNGAKIEAEAQSLLRRPRHNVSVIHSVLNGTTRLPEFRDGRVEENGLDYDFAFDYESNKRLASLLKEGQLVQYAQPRGGHVYFTELDSFPTSGIALMDTVPATLRDLNRILLHANKKAIGIYRTVDTFEDWMLRINGRGDIFNKNGDVIDPENYNARMTEAQKSIVEALDLRKELDIHFFAAEERPEAGKAVIDILTNHHTEDMQKRALRGAALMLKGLAIKGFKSKN